MQHQPRPTRRARVGRRSWIGILLAVAALAPAPASAQQQGSGALAGRVVDDEGKALARADVVLQPLGRSAVADRDGRFRWAALAPCHRLSPVSSKGVLSPPTRRRARR